MIIQLTKNKDTEICACHYDLVKNYKWHITGSGYAARFEGRKIIYMHRSIMGAINQDVDHIDRHKLNNKCSNLRLVTRSENCLNKAKQKNNTSGYIGVTLHKQGKWLAQIIKNKQRIYLGLFENIEDAARAYNNAAKELHGNFARLNLIQ